MTLARRIGRWTPSLALLLIGLGAPRTAPSQQAPAEAAATVEMPVVKTTSTVAASKS
jgi:hypothetical protein